jgi:integrase
MASIRRRKDRKSGWIVDCRDVPAGRRLTVATREQAELLRAKMIHDSQHAASAMQDRDITLDAYADRWLEQIASSVDERTAASYADTLRLHIRPILGKVMLRALLRGHCKTLLAKKRAGGLSKNSVRLIRATLSVMLSDAVDDGILMVNPALGINRKGRKSPDSMSKKDWRKSVKAMTHEQLSTFLAFSAARCSRRIHALHLLLADAGPRPGEACGVQWSDLDVVGLTLRVERSVTDGGRIKETKTGEDREVDLTPRLVTVLSSLQAELEAEALLAGRRGISQWVFATRAGTPPRPHRVAKTFQKVLLAAGLPHFRLYDLRHTYASHLIAERADISYVAKQLGHSKMTTTLLFYSHWFPKGDRRYVEHVEKLRAAAVPLRMPTPHDDSGATLHAEILTDGSWHHFGPKSESGVPDVSETPDLLGGPSRTRTLDPLIKSQRDLNQAKPISARGLPLIRLAA